MTHDDGLAHRGRGTLDDRPDVEERERYGRLGFLLDGNLCVGVVGDALVARVDPEADEEAPEEPHARPFGYTGRPITGWVFLDPPGLVDEGLAP